ncbi:hypothetical protein EHZ18_26215 [Burkholderia vietnamiensis]|nr:hypothetical protein EHZ18_26215 [Burkholderia vietnamiensis]
MVEPRRRRCGAGVRVREERVRLLLDEARVGPEALLIAVLGADELHVALVDRHHAETLAFGHRQATVVVEVLLLRLRLAVTLVAQYGVQIVLRQATPRILRQLDFLRRLDGRIAAGLSHRHRAKCADDRKKNTGSLHHVLSPCLRAPAWFSYVFKGDRAPAFFTLEDRQAIASTFVVRSQ